jgi:hypothetical protein
MRLLDRLRNSRGPLAAAAVALLFALVLFARGHPYDQDQLALGLPYARIFRDAVKAHRAPLWSNLIWCGYPVHAEGQGGFLAFPFRLVAALAPDELSGTEAEITLALVLAALAGAFAARLMGRSHAASATAGIIWALGGGLLSYQENAAVLEACWAMPLLITFPQRRLGGLLLGLMLLAGWPYAFALTVPLLLFTWKLKDLAVAVAIGLLIGAAQWVPTAELFLHSDRASGLAAKDVLRGVFGPSDLARLVSPLIPLADRITERSVVFAYVGLPALVLALVGAKRSIGRKSWFLPGALVVSLLIALLPALAPGLAATLVAIPPLSLVRGPDKLLIVFGLAASLLAAEGVDAFPKRARLLLVLVALDLFQFGQRRALPVERALFRTTPDVARAIPPGARTLTFMAQPLPWFHGLDAASFRALAMIDPNANVRWGIPTVGGYGPLPIARSKELAVHPSPNRLARAGAEYLVAPAFFPGRDLAVVGTFVTTMLFVLLGVPHARRASDAAVTSSAAKAFDLAGEQAPTIAVLEEPLGHSIVEGKAHLALENDDELSVDVSAPGEALLVLAFTYMPGWEASVDGASARVLRADSAFMAVPLPAGAKRVELRYRPTSFRVGLALSALGLFALFALALRKTVSS